jgi:two-component system response regulator MprA
MIAKRILLVEDDPAVRESCAELLRDFGHTVVAVDDGAIALGEIPRFHPDVILVDLVMPKAELDGVALLSRLAAGPRIPVVILSAFADGLSDDLSPDVKAALPITAILTKPFSLDELTREIDRAPVLSSGHPA